MRPSAHSLFQSTAASGGCGRPHRRAGQLAGAHRLRCSPNNACGLRGPQPPRLPKVRCRRDQSPQTQAMLANPDLGHKATAPQATARQAFHRVRRNATNDQRPTQSAPQEPHYKRLWRPVCVGGRSSGRGPASECVGGILVRAWTIELCRILLPCDTKQKGCCSGSVHEELTPFCYS